MFASNAQLVRKLCHMQSRGFSGAFKKRTERKAISVQIHDIKDKLREKSGS